MTDMPSACWRRRNHEARTFSSRALWCSNKDFRALRTSTSLETPDGDWACRLTTVIRSDRSCLDTRHSRCSSSSWRGTTKELSSSSPWEQKNSYWIIQVQLVILILPVLVSSVNSIYSDNYSCCMLFHIPHVLHVLLLLLFPVVGFCNINIKHGKIWYYEFMKTFWEYINICNPMMHHDILF